MVELAMSQANGNQTNAAKLLDIVAIPFATS